MYALVAAHLAHLLLNWNDESFVFRQRVNCDGSRNTGNRIKHKPPHAIPANFARNIRYVRLIFTLLVLIWEVYLYRTAKDNFDKDISYITHLCGAASGLVIGYIFLTARHTRKAEKILKYVLFTCVYGLAIGYILLRGITAQQEAAKCTWIEYESQCQEKCYRHLLINNTCGVNIYCSHGAIYLNSTE